MDDFISSRSGDSVLEPQPAEHLIYCERCRSLTRLLDKAGDWPRPSECLLRRIQIGIMQDLKPIRPLAPFPILLFGCAIIFLSVMAVGVLLLGMNGWGALSLVQRIVVFVTLAACAVLLAYRPARRHPVFQTHRRRCGWIGLLGWSERAGGQLSQLERISYSGLARRRRGNRLPGGALLGTAVESIERCRK
jgi:hypothetical protein